MKRYRVEIGFGLLCFGISIFLERFPDYESFKQIFMVISFLVPIIVIWLRHCITHDLHGFLQFREFFQTIDLCNYGFLPNDEEFQIVEKATKTLHETPFRANIIKEQIQHLCNGFYTIANSKGIYDHNALCLEKLKKKQEFRTTHSAKLNKDAINYFWGPNINPYSGLISAHCKAAERGVKVTRIYVFEEYPEEYFFCDKNSNYQKEIASLLRSGVDVKVALYKNLNPEFSEGITIIDNTIIGIVEKAQPSLCVCKYYVKIGKNYSTDGNNVQKHIEYYDKLYEIGKKLCYNIENNKVEYKEMEKNE